MTTTDPFTEAARAEAEDYARTPRMNVGTVRDRIAEAHRAGAEWARTHLAAQEPTAVEHRIARLEAQTDIRGRAVVIYRERAREAEAQIKAVEDVLDTWMTYCQTEQAGRALSGIRRALESVPPPRA